MTSWWIHHHMYKTCHKVRPRPSQWHLSDDRYVAEIRETEKWREWTYLNEGGLEGHSGT